MNPNSNIIPQTMQAAFLYGIRDVRIDQVPTPTPGPGEVLLQIAAVGVCGSDVHYYLEGRIGSQVVTDPIVMGHEFSARVAALGPGVAGLEIGQLVAVDPAIPCGACEQCLQGHPNLCPQVRFCGTPPINGVFAEYAVMPAENCFPLPANVTAEQGAMLEPLGVALHAVNLAHLKPGDTVAVLGAGPIGLLTAAVAKASGASAIWMTEPLAYRRDFAEETVADGVFDPIDAGGIEAIQRLSGGRGVDVVFESAGAPVTPQHAVQLARFGGKVILTAIPADDTIAFSASISRRKGLTIKMVRRMKHTYPRAISLVERGVVDVNALITHRMPLSQTGKAMDLISGYQDQVIKAMIRF